MLRVRSQSGSPVEGSVNTPGEDVEDIVDASPRTLRPSGERMVTAVLPNGRVAWLQVRPSLATAAQVNRLAYTAERASDRQIASARADSAAITRLSRVVDKGVRKLTKARVRANRTLLKSIAIGDAKVDRAITVAKVKSDAEIRQQMAEIQRQADKLRIRDLWDQIVLVSSTLQFAAFGQRGEPLGPFNLALTVSVLTWLVGDEISDYLTGEKTIAGGILKDVDLWAYVAPFANLLSGWWLLHNEQHERFTTGTTASFTVFQGLSFKTSDGIPIPTQKTISETYVATVDIAALGVAPDYSAQFASIPEPPVVASIIQYTMNQKIFGIRLTPVIASVTDGVLTLTVTATAPPPEGQFVGTLLTRLEVAWIIDTRDPAQ